MWISLKAKVVQLWESDKSSISQVGLLGDETGIIKFVAFSKSELPLIEEGKSYHFSKLVTDSWQGRFSVKLNKATVITPDRGRGDRRQRNDDDRRHRGRPVRQRPDQAVPGVQPAAEQRRLRGPREAGRRVRPAGKAVLDDGKVAQDIILNQEMTYTVTGIDVKIAKKMAMDAVDPAVVLDEIKRILLGKYFTVSGRVMGGRYLLVNEMNRTARDITLDEVLKNVGAI